MDVNFCPACAAAFDAPDNFCRRCGEQLATRSLPVVLQPNRSLLVRQDVPPVLVKTAAALAAGTVLQIAGRALLSALSQRASSPPPSRLPERRPTRTISETVYIRRTQVRLD
jgi:hypothetical protein